MKNRMGLRRSVHHTTTWAHGVREEDPPDWKVWRTRAGPLEVDDEQAKKQPVCEREVCRAVRGFVGRKPFQRDVEST